jgi:hypothetical protein
LDERGEASRRFFAAKQTRLKKEQQKEIKKEKKVKPKKGNKKQQSPLVQHTMMCPDQNNCRRCLVLLTESRTGCYGEHGVFYCNNKHFYRPYKQNSLMVLHTLFNDAISVTQATPSA